MRRALALTTAVAATGALALGVATPASATTHHKPHKTHVSAYVYPAAKPVTIVTQPTTLSTTVHSGAWSRIYGYAGPSAWKHRVSLQRYWSKRWHTVGHQNVNSDNAFSFGVRPLARGTYAYRLVLSVHKGYAASTSRTLHVRVMTQYTISRYYSSRGDWSGPRIRIPTRDYRVGYAIRTQYDGESVNLWWTPDHNYSENWGTAPARGRYTASGAWYGHQGNDTGYFEVITEDDVAWSLHISYPGWH